ncbi:NBR1-Ig-like domain-containing protein [Candidatus Leptofilum sp.]|uniref:NBR1-Ig-like domain-containing protein n=1 Tax=Candidatus Leptofilum sp. TaxID=3241576 RepID=UPI003B5B23DD
MTGKQIITRFSKYSTPTIRSIGHWLLLLLILMLPFELDQPIVHVGPLAITNVELVLGLTLLVAGLLWWQQRPFNSLPAHRWIVLLVAGGMFVGTAVLAPEQSGNALKASLRLLSGIGLALAVPQLVGNAAQRTKLIWAMIASGLLIASIGISELWLGRELGWLLPFRAGITVAGEFLRLTGPLDYANHAAMYLEAIVPLLLMVGWLWWQRTRKTAVFLLNLLFLLLLLQASFLTLSRAAFLTIGTVSGAMLLLSRWRLKIAQPWLGLLGLVGLLFVFHNYASEAFRLRLGSEGDSSWYLAEWQVPQTLTLVANETHNVPLTVTNNGTLIWSSQRQPPINLGGRWIQNESGLQLAEPRWPFDQPVLPGQTVSLQIPLRAPTTPGEYTLIWDVVQEQITWFGEKSNLFATTSVVVVPGNAEADLPPDTAVPAWAYQLPIPDRSTLWPLALQMIGERPLLGIGLDNFRLVYGRLLGAASWNETIHTNNWYLEFLVGGGLLAAVPFFVWLIWEGKAAWHVLRQRPVDAWQMAIFASLLSYLIHGLVDFFLLFNSTGLLFWLLVGLWWQSQYVAADSFRAAKTE